MKAARELEITAAAQPLGILPAFGTLLHSAIMQSYMPVLLGWALHGSRSLSPGICKPIKAL
jgi:hypothetical protein